MELVVGFIVLMVVIAVVVVIATESGKKKAFEDYQSTLRRLEQNPTDPNLRATALQLGRVYSNLTRNNQGVTIYDEMAIKNDLDAATAGAVKATPTITVPAQQEVGTHAERLRKLDYLYGQGLISDEEHDSQRSRILAEI